MTKRAATCDHAEQILVTSSREGIRGCEECLKIGGRWVHLRQCLSCGKVGCCDSSPNKHARQHFNDDGHAIVQSVEPGETWVYCYADDYLLTDPPSPNH